MIIRTFHKILHILIFILWHLSACYSQEALVAHFIDVGQADATFLEFPCGAILIDAGSQDRLASNKLMSYLSYVFSKRGDLNNTIDAVFISHNHRDHTNALKLLLSQSKIKVKRFIDNGPLDEKTVKCVSELKENGTIPFREITSSSIGENGLTNNIIDPLFPCGNSDVDPTITVLFSRLTNKPPTWSNRTFTNENNHSLVIRVDYGKTSLLFTGDLEVESIDSLLSKYKYGDLLDVDIYQVGHHGSQNGTTPELLEAISPKFAVISCGKSNYGMSSNISTTTAFRYGHPREMVVNLLLEEIDGQRRRPKIVKVAKDSKFFVDKEVYKNVYATAWDSNIRVMCFSNGEIKVFSDR